MKVNLIQIMFSGCIALTSLIGFTTTTLGWQPSFVDQWFDTYGDISWEDEKAHLDNLAIALQEDPNLIGYMIVYAGRCACVNEAKDHALRAKKYLVETRGIHGRRVKWIDGGYRERLTVILQPVPSGAPKPNTSRTVKPADVQLNKNCKPQTSKHRRSGSYKTDYAISNLSLHPDDRDVPADLLRRSAA